MQTVLLATKLYIPQARGELIARPRLMARLNEGVSRRLIVVSAPPGFGKTTLLGAWIRQQPLPAAWLSLDGGDNDPARFLAYLVAALQTAIPGLAAFQASTSLELALASLINQLAAVPGDFVLVLDDYHVIESQPVHNALSYLIEHGPPQLHLILSSRADPPFPLARLRGRGQLVEVRQRDLRFTSDETALFLNQIMGLALTAQEVNVLEAQTEGWIGALQLAALSMQGRGDLSGFVRSFTGSHVFVAEYLVEEVLQRQPEDVQTFLLHTSILDRLSAGLCEAVTGRLDGQAMLLGLQRANLFVIPLDDRAEWFRYHHLFADLLRASLQHTQSPEAITALHRRAAAWYREHGFVAEAVHHALTAREFSAAADLVEQHGYPMLVRGEMATVIRWFDALPGEIAQQRPMLCIMVAWVLTLAGAAGRVEPLLQQAEAQVTSETPIAREVLGNAAAMRAFFAMLAGDGQRSLALAERAETFLPEPSPQVRSILMYVLGSAYRSQGQYEKAAAAFARQAEIGEMSGDLLLWVTGLCEVVNTRSTRGRLCEAVELCRLTLSRLAERQADRFGSLAKLEVALCNVLRERYELAEAHQRLLDVLARMEGWDMPTDQLFAYLALIRVQEAEGDFAGAFESLRFAKDVRAAHPVLIPLAHAVDFHEIRLLLATHDLVAAAQRVESFESDLSPNVPVRDQQLTMLARVRFAQGQTEAAASILSALTPEAEAAGRQTTLLECLALHACVLETQGKGAAALELLIRALTLAEPEGFVSIFADKGKVMQSLLVAARGRVPPPLKTYLAKLLDAFPASPASTPDLVDPLTPREVEVLQLIAAGDSNQTIADKLVITLNGVKKHTGNIFSKLNVSSRTQAIARARQLGLLPTDE